MQPPLELRLVLKGLGNETSLAVFVAMLESKEVSFTELKKKTGLEGSALAYQLGRLMESALVEHYYRHELGNEKYSFYAVTVFGRRFWGTMIEAIVPKGLGKSMKPDEPVSGGATTQKLAVNGRKKAVRA